MSEFAIIKNYCQGIGQRHPETKISVGDDAAVIAVPVDQELAVSVDTMVAGVHFFPQTSPRLLARKLLSVNVSDMAAMGAKAKWATLALTLPDSSPDWLQEFSDALHERAREYGVELIGGDTTQGPLTLSLQIMGLVEQGKAILRSTAKVGDHVYVSNHLGDAALALRLINEGKTVDDGDLIQLRLALDDPQPQLALGQRLINIASAAIDVSDGLVADLTHIAQASKVGIEVSIEQVPTSPLFRSAGGEMNDALYGGDDYQLAFCVPQDKVSMLDDVQQELNIHLTCIGRVVHGKEGVALTHHGRAVPSLKAAGFEHFKNQR